MLCGFLIHAMLFCFFLGVFFHAVHLGIGNHAGNGHRMPDVRRQVNTVTLDFPGAAFAGGEVVFIGVIAFCRQPVSVRVFLWVVFLSCPQPARSRLQT